VYHNFNNGILKVYAAFDSSKFDINQESINSDKIRVALNNNNFYLNSSYKGVLEIIGNLLLG
jgi:hypothetical protein